jgi:protein-tyrosine phosphatase
MNRVLFLCSANYYRSRFAEHLFNWLASKADLPWRADSRGLSSGHGANIGPISRYAVDGLTLWGVPINGEHRHPMLLTLTDLTASDLVVAPLTASR